MTSLLLAVLLNVAALTLLMAIALSAIRGLWQEYKRQRALDRLDRENRRKMRIDVPDLRS